MSSHLTVGDPKPAFDSKNKFRIYSMLYCPFAQRVRLVLAAKDLTDYDIVNIKLREERPEWYTSLNPSGKVPTVEFPNGEAIYESLIVADLLDELYPEKLLNPSDPVAKAKQKLFVDRFGNGFIPSSYKYIRERTEENKQVLVEKLSECEKYLKDGKFEFFGGDQPAMVDYMIWPFFERLPMVYELSSEMHPHLVNWYNKMTSVPSVKKIALPVEVYKKFYEANSKGQANYDIV